jgi:uncharacterized protein YecE (DUF72 family)
MGFALSLSGRIPLPLLGTSGYKFCMAHIGTSGWSYDHWQGVLYPDNLPRTQRLDVYQSQFHTAELNSSYYHWPKESTFTSWKRRLPQGFRLAVKAPGLLTHVKRLYSPENWLTRISHDVSRLGNHCGPLLVQLPPTMPYDHPRLAYLLGLLPSTLQVAMEFRHPSWHQETVFSLLEQHNVAYCVMSGAHLPCILRATANFVYVRLHGPDRQHLYAGAYSEADLWWWAERIREWEGVGKEVFAYFNNDGAGNAVRNARRLKELLL